MCFRIIVFIGNFFGCVIETTNPDRLDDNAFGRKERKKKTLSHPYRERDIYVYIPPGCLHLLIRRNNHTVPWDASFVLIVPDIPLPRANLFRFLCPLESAYSVLQLVSARIVGTVVVLWFSWVQNAVVIVATQMIVCSLFDVV
uniref:Putative secreted protein n=1 Tax=Anopheles darlingi TaxID=43151 RepID=A0A2M4DRS3_ANODA